MTRFPLFGIIDGKCACGNAECKAVGKHPRVANWMQGAPVEEGEPYGIVAGTPSGVFVVDLDVKYGGIANWFSLVGDRIMPKTRMVLTGGGGAHLYFSLPSDFVVKNSVGKLGKGIDVRGEGGYVVGPGSPHASGSSYVLLNPDEPISDAPEWLLELLRSPERAEVSGDFPRVNPADPTYERRLAIAKEVCLAEKLHLRGTGEEHLTFILFQKLVRGLRLPDPAAYAVFALHYDSRLPEEDRWSDYGQVKHKLEQAARGSAIGLDQMWQEAGIREAVANNAKPTATRNLAPVPKSAAYKFTPGEASTKELHPATSFNDLVHSLRTHPDWEGVLRYDVFARKLVAVSPPCELNAEKGGMSDADCVMVKSWFETEGITVAKEVCHDAVRQAAMAAPVHPVREYLSSCERGVGTIRDLVRFGLGLEDERAADYVRKFMIGAVRRIVSPGCQMDTMLVLFGPQGCRKTSFVRELFSYEWSRSQMPELASKDASSALKGFWAIEFGELDRLLRTEASTVKEYLTRTYDDYRPPYGRDEQRFPRECVFIGTTNEKEFLRDVTGSRRFWPLTVGKIDTDWVRTHRDSVWAEAYAAAVSGEAHWYEDDSALEASKEDYVQLDPWYEHILTYCVGQTTVRPEAIFKTIDDSISNLTPAARNRITDTLERLKCRSVRVTENGKRFRAWEVPDALSKLPKHSPLSLVKTVAASVTKG